MRGLLFSLIAGVTLALSAVARADPPAGYAFLDHDAGLRLAKAENKPILLYFGRYGCAWCDQVNRTTFADAEIRRIFGEHYALIYVDAEGGRRIRLPGGERVSEAELAYATPLFVFMTPEGKVIARIPGYKTVRDFQDYDRYVRGGHHRTQSLLEFLGGRP
ncbi:MAG: thioredoxin-like protein [bacterium]|nr:MAG: thioredoxin-like protein [bacterium]